MKNKKMLLVSCLMAVSCLSSCLTNPSESVSTPSETPSNIISPSTNNSTTPSVQPSSPSEESSTPSEESSTPSESTTPSVQPSTPSESTTPSVQPSTPSEESSTPSESTTPSGDSSTPEESTPEISTPDISVPSETPNYDTISIDEAISLTKQLAQNTKSSESYYIKGKVSEIWNATYGNFNFGPKDNQFTIYGTYSSDGSVAYKDMEAKVALNDEIVFYGKLYHYYKASSTTPTKYEVENAWLISINGVAVNKDGTLAGSQSGGNGNNDSSSSGTTTPINPGDQWTNNQFGDYYKDIDFSNTSTLLKQLQTLNGQKRKSTVGYSSMPSQFKYTDYDPNSTISYDSKGQPYSNQIIGFYTNRSATYSGNMNREHVWPNSRGGSAVENDIHMTRPTFTSDNSSRGNSFYVANMASSSGGWDPKTAGMLEQSRGHAARIVFYCVVANSGFALSDSNNITSGQTGYKYTMGKISDLLKWNLQYPVDVTEVNRNSGAQYLQGNRNPFIDNPYLACAIWGNFNDTTREICKDYGVIVDPYTGDITLPDGPSVPSSPSVQPSEQPSSSPSTQPSIPSNPENNDGGYYQKVSADQTDWSGNYLIVYESGSYALNPTVASINSNANKEGVTIINSKIAWTETLENISVTISKTTGGYTIKTSSGKYIGATANANTISLESNALINTISFVSASDISIVSSAGTHLRFNKDWGGFRYYGSGQSAIQLYKYVAE